MSLRFYSVVIDCKDVAAQGHWWAKALDYQTVYESEDEVALVPAGVDPEQRYAADEWAAQQPALVFVPVEEGKTLKNRLHLDFAPHTSQDRDAEIARLIELGATRVDVGQSDDVTWTVLADPEGNEFCVLSSRDR